MLDLLTTATIQSPRTDVEYLKRGGDFLCCSRAFGGERFAQGLASLAVLLAPILFSIRQLSLHECI